MMRPYRGKRTDNGEWVEGWYVRMAVRHLHLVRYMHYIYDDHNVSHEVDPTTVGQDTGREDGKSAKLFESDLWEYHGVVYVVTWNPDEAKFYFKHPNPHAYDDDQIEMGWSTHGEKVGNTHDNPELLKI